MSSKSRAPPKSNVALLTEGASYIRRAKRAQRGEPAVEKVVFDDDARREYLTGFSKRKKAKVEEKRERAKKKAHEDHLAQRRQAREDLKQRARENFISVRRAMGLEDLDESEADEGIFSDPEGTEPTMTSRIKGKERAERAGSPGDDDEDEEGQVEVEYEDGDQQAVVTITDDFDEDLDLGLGSTASRKRKSRDDDDDEEDATSDAEPTTRRPAVPLMPASSRKQQKKALSTAATKKSISLGFPSARTNTSSKNHVASDYRAYESKAERKKVKEKERGRRNQKWELAKERGTAGGGRGRNSSRGRGRGKAAGKGKK